MKIDAQNIEEVIFDFHEGNLSDTEKAALMDFMHKHPEYEREFALWAKSYHYASEPVPEYGHDDRFVKPHVPVYAKWTGFAAGICVVLATWYWWPTKAIVSPHTMEGERIKKTSKTGGSLLLPSENQNIIPAEKQKVKVTKKEELANPISSGKEIKGIDVKPVTFDSAIVSEKTFKTPQVKDSVSVFPSITPTETLAKEEPKGKQLPPSTTKKPKRKRKMDLTPTDDILPFNSDF